MVTLLFASHADVDVDGTGCRGCRSLQLTRFPRHDTFGLAQKLDFSSQPNQ